MQTRMHFGILAAIFISLSMSGCTTTPNMSTADRDAYLQKFIGQSSKQIRAEFNLANLGYQQAKPISLTNNALTYTAVRPLPIPIGTGGAVPIPFGSSAESYDVNLQCQIRFILHNHIAQSVQTTGRTC